MARLSRSELFGSELCKALGIDPDKVFGISLDVRPGSLVMVDIHRYVTEDEAKRIVHLLENYSVQKISTVEVGDEEPEIDYGAEPPDPGPW